MKFYILRNRKPLKIPCISGNGTVLWKLRKRKPQKKNYILGGTSKAPKGNFFIFFQKKL